MNEPVPQPRTREDHHEASSHRRRRHGHGCAGLVAGCGAMATHLLADAEAAEVLLPLLSPYRGQLPNTGAVVMPAVDHTCGLLAATLGDMDGARMHLDRAVDLHHAALAPLLVRASEAARTALDD